MNSRRHEERMAAPEMLVYLFSVLTVSGSSPTWSNARAVSGGYPDGPPESYKRRRQPHHSENKKSSAVRSQRHLVRKSSKRVQAEEPISHSVQSIEHRASQTGKIICIQVRV